MPFTKHHRPSWRATLGSHLASQPSPSPLDPIVMTTRPRAEQALEQVSAHWDYIICIFFTFIPHPERIQAALWGFVNFSIYMYMCVPACLYVHHMHAGADKGQQQRVSDPAELELQVVLSGHEDAGKLRTKPGSSARAVGALNH